MGSRSALARVRARVGAMRAAASTLMDAASARVTGHITEKEFLDAMSGVTLAMYGSEPEKHWLHPYEAEKLKARVAELDAACASLRENLTACVEAEGVAIHGMLLISIGVALGHDAGRETLARLQKAEATAACYNLSSFGLLEQERDALKARAEKLEAFVREVLEVERKDLKAEVDQLKEVRTDLATRLLGADARALEIRPLARKLLAANQEAARLRARLAELESTTFSPMPTEALDIQQSLRMIAIESVVTRPAGDAVLAAAEWMRDLYAMCERRGAEVARLRAQVAKMREALEQFVEVQLGALTNTDDVARSSICLSCADLTGAQTAARAALSDSAQEVSE